MIIKNRVTEPTISYGQMNLLFHLRNIWREMATWTRAYLVSRFAGIPQTEYIFNRLYKIPREFGNLIQVIFGSEFAEQYVHLLSTNLVQSRELVEAQIAGNTDLANEIVQQLYQGADTRAALLASVNPFWDETEWRNLIYTYIQYTIEEMTAIATNEFERNIDIYDRLLHLADNIGDYFAQGIFNYLTYNIQPISN